MGVTGLWTVVQPCARPIKIETLNKKRLAVDASIWIYQFLKAVRDKEGNALRNSHVVGFFRRICKLLFIGVKPVFVFDGGAPALKRQTIISRKQRREGRREDAARTAGKLLAVQMQRIAEEEEQKRKAAIHRGPEREEEELPENLVYVDELQMDQRERQQNRKFRKKDQYHLPELDVSLAEMGAPNDPRIMSLEELEAYARQFDTGEDINVYDFSKIDFDSPFFTSLPASDRYNILNAARLRSRLRMGYSKEQLDSMFPDRMAFSKFQIERVTERNELTQRLMNINGMNDDTMFGAGGQGRVAGEKGMEYVLVKNDGVEGGWALGVIGGRDEGAEAKPIDVEKLEDENDIKDEDEDEWEDGDDFEDVPIEGLNRLPKLSAPARPRPSNGNRLGNRRTGFGSRRKRPRAPLSANRPTAAATTTANEDPDSLFVADEPDEADEDMQDGEGATDDEHVDRAIAISLEQDEDEQDLNRAIAMSLEKESDEQEHGDWLDTFQQSRADEEVHGIARKGGKAIAHMWNSRAGKVVPAAKKKDDDAASDEDLDFEDAMPGTSGQDKIAPVLAPTLPRQESDSDEDDVDFGAALARSRRTQQQPKQPASRVSPPKQPKPDSKGTSAFSGPLPFESLNLGSSILGKKKIEKLQEASAGGFERKDTGPAAKKKNKAEPLPPWFEGNLDEDLAAQKEFEKEERRKAAADTAKFRFEEPPTLRRHVTGEVIDLEATEGRGPTTGEVIDLEAADDEEQEKEVIAIESADELEDVPPRHESPVMGEIADDIRANPPTLDPVEQQSATISDLPPILRNEATSESADTVATHAEEAPVADSKRIQRSQSQGAAEDQSAEDAPLDWSDSDGEEAVPKPSVLNKPPPNDSPARDASASPSPDFEDVEILDKPSNEQSQTKKTASVAARQRSPSPAPPAPAPVSGAADENLAAEAGTDEFGYYSDSEDDELMQQLATEAEEHARFASTLNNKTQRQNIEDYERELKQLRSQQKKDRRDADEVTHIMIQECQQLLKLFGLPYITAPMEAEAQCAELVNLGLVDGIVTDDSDCFLFGGTRIYKNMFNQAKFVECYLSSDFEKEFDLGRQKLIGVAQLLGSDYTEGLPGVGPVTALEILSEFPSLRDFKDWWEGVQMNTIPKSADAGNPFRRKFRRNAAKIFLPPSFPDPRVEMAYLQPEVDSDPSAFQWGVPDLGALRSFLMATIGWSAERTDEVLVPVIKDINRRQDEGTQSNITAFFDGGTGAGSYAPRVRAELGSKRMGNALERMANKAKRKRKGDGDGDEAMEKTAEAGEDTNASGTAAPSKRAKRKTKGKRAGAEVEMEEAA